MRTRFAAVVNEVLVRDNVKDRNGDPVRYDARSYKAMGLDVVPMRSINRIVADKLKSGKLTVLDGDYTRKMIEAELREARGRRDRRLSELDKLGKAIDRLGKDPQAKDARKGLPKEMRPSPLAKLGGKIVAKAGEQVLKARYAAYVHDVMEQSSRSTLDRIVEATDPKVIAESAKATKDPVKRAALPDIALAAALHAEAVEMRDRFERDNAKERERLRLRVGQALNRWSKTVAPPAPEASPTVKRERRRMMSHQDAERAIRSAQAATQARDGQQKADAEKPRSAAAGTTPTREPPAAVRPEGRESSPAPAGVAPAARSTASVEAGTEAPSSGAKGAAGKAPTAAEVHATPPAGTERAPQTPPSQEPNRSDAGTKAPAAAAAGATPPAGVASAAQTPPSQGQIPPRRKPTEKEKAEFRRNFDAATAAIMKGLRSLRSIPDVEKRMTALEQFAKAPFGPIDDNMKQIIEAAWKTVPGATEKAGPGPVRSDATTGITPDRPTVDTQRGPAPEGSRPSAGPSLDVAPSATLPGPTTGPASPPASDRTVGARVETTSQLSLNLEGAARAVKEADAPSVATRNAPHADGRADGRSRQEKEASASPAPEQVRDGPTKLAALPLPTAKDVARDGAALALDDIVGRAEPEAKRESIVGNVGTTAHDLTAQGSDVTGEGPRRLTPEEEAEALRLAKAEREKKHRKALLSKGKGKGGRGR